jgi:nucleoside 2-deoxyribosyltransferase
MKKLTIYIASSWKNQHAVEMLTAILRENGHTVISWVENNYGEGHNHVTKKFDFETWVNSKESEQSFQFDTEGATTSDLVIYLGPSGKDAAAEVGAAWAKGVPVIGLWAKGEDFGLMRKMIKKWYERVPDLINELYLYSVYDSVEF